MENTIDLGVIDTSDVEFFDGSEERVGAFLASEAVPDQIRDRVGWLADRLADLDVEIKAKRIAADDLHGEMLNARGTSTAAKARARYEAASADLSAAMAERSTVKALHGAARKLVAGFRPRPVEGQPGTSMLEGQQVTPPSWRDDGIRFYTAQDDVEWTTAKPIEIVEPVLPEGNLAAFINEQRAEIARLRDQRASVEAAPLPASMVKRQIRARVDKLAALGRIDVSLPDAKPAKIAWPMKSLGAAPPRDNPGAIPRGIDVEAVLCNLFGDQIVAAAEQAIDEEYAGTEVVFEPHARRRRIKELDSQILATERIEAAAIWEAIEAGVDINFRPDTDPRAVLGIAA